MSEDKQLIRSFKNGNTEALRRIYDKYRLDLLKLAVSITGDVSLAEDAVQDVFVKLAQSADTLSVDGSLKSFLCVCTINRIRTIFRDSRNQMQKVIENAGDSVDIRPKSPLGWAILTEELAMISQALMQLPIEQREVVVLRLYEMMPFGEIARLQQSSINTVQGRFRYGMDKLRSLLDGGIRNETDR
ncbi:MAG: RNA polymerase sigma factor [Planctomycetota bacterium]|jgi:RNA polymerase sigma-70 factor (ECF subfamily)